MLYNPFQKSLARHSRALHHYISWQSHETNKKKYKKKEDEGEGGEERKGDIKTPGFPAYPYTPLTQLPIQTGVSAPTASGEGWFWVLMRAPACFEPSLKS